MITKERLEEIRKRKYAEDRIVYTVFDNDKEATALHIVYDNEWFVAYMMLKRVYETKEEAEWHCKMNAERTEQFDPPMWEEIKDKYCFGICKNFGKYEEHYVLDVSKNCNIDWAITVERDSDIIYSGKATKENYEKACEIVRVMFIK